MFAVVVSSSAGLSSVLWMGVLMALFVLVPHLGAFQGVPVRRVVRGACVAGLLALVFIVVAFDCKVWWFLIDCWWA